MADELETIARFSNPVEAALAYARLVDDGIDAVTSGDAVGNMLGMGFATGGITLLVPSADVERARAALADLAAEIEATKHRPPHAITAEAPVEGLTEEPPTPEEIAARPNFAEQLTIWAFRASWMGLLFCFYFAPIVHLYALLLLLYATFLGEPIRSDYTKRYYAAFVMSALSVAIGIAAAVYLRGLAVLAIPAALGVGMFLLTILLPRSAK